MKIRNGFISNSSSSSFVLIVDKATLAKALENLPMCYTKISNVVFHYKPFLNSEVAIMHDYSNHGGECFEVQEFEELIYSLVDDGSCDVSEFLPKDNEEDDFSWNESYYNFKSKLRKELRKFENSTIEISF